MKQCFLIAFFLLFPVGNSFATWTVEGSSHYCNVPADPIICAVFIPSSTCYIYTYNATSGLYHRYYYANGTSEATCYGVFLTDHCVSGTHYNSGLFTDYTGHASGDLDDFFYNTARSCKSNLPNNADFDIDGASDYCEVNFGSSSDFFDVNTVSQCTATDTDDDGISDTVEELLGTDSEIADDTCSANYENFSFTNYDPVAHDYVVGFYLTSGAFWVYEYFSLPAMPAFGDPPVYTLGDYGEIPCGVTIKVYELADQIPTTEVASLSDPLESNGPQVDWDVLEMPEYDGTVGDDGMGEYVTQGADNSDTASEIWDEETTPVPDVVLPGSTEADVQIDPKDIAQGVALALNHITELADPEIIETNDEDINWAITSTQGILDDFGDTGFGDEEVITSGDTDNALGVLSWIDDFWTVPEIGQTSFLTIDGFEIMGFEFPDIIINFDYEIVPAIRTLFLFFFYLSCVWIFFRLTRYAWG